MLLRSSSTPILGTLPPFSQSDALPEPPKNESLLSSEVAKSLSFSSSSSRSLTSPSAQSIAGSEAFSGEEKHWDSDAEVVLRQARVRRAQSENDLQSLGLGSFAPATLAAKCFLCNDQVISGLIEEDSSFSAKKSWPRLSNRRWGRSFSSTHSACLGAIGLDRNDFIPEEEVYSTIESGCFDESSFAVERSCLVCNDQLCYADHEIRTKSPVPGRVLEVRNGEVGVIEKPNCAMSDLKALDTLLSNRDEKAVFSGRVDFTQVSDGEYYSSSKVGVNEAVSAECNSLEYRPLHVDEQSKPLCNRGGMDVGDSISGGGRGGPPMTTSSGGGSGADADITDLYYQKMLVENPGHPLFLQNYSKFLAEVKRDYSKAEEYFARAILANPSDGEMLAQYAKIIWEVHQDAERASNYFERAVQAAPDDSYVMAAYASFLWNSEEGEEELQVNEMQGGPGSLLPSPPSLVSAGPA